MGVAIGKLKGVERCDLDGDGVPEDGKVKFAAGSKDAGAETFFMKVK